MKLSRILVALVVVAVLAGSTPAYADQPHGTNLSLTFNGAILSSGSQSYSHSGGQLVAGSVLGQALNPTRSNLDYSLQAKVDGLSVKGHAHFEVTTYKEDGSTIKVKGDAQIVDMIPAETFPLGCTYGADCTSAIPGIFLGAASVTIQNCPSHGQGSGGHGTNDNGQGDNGCGKMISMTLPMQFESAFLNPFGGPIFFASNGGEVYFVATYSASRVVWTGIQLGGTATGTLAGNPVSGEFGMKVSAFEDLKGGYELETGSISFVGMTPSSLNAAGLFTGRSTIPAGTACPSDLGFPPGTCQLTGFNSKGSFVMKAASGGSIVGGYTTQWTAPAVAFTSSVTATVSGH